MNPHKVPRRTLAQIFAVPLLVAVMSGTGLISALIGDGVWDALSWLMLGMPICLCLAFLYRRKPG